MEHRKNTHRRPTWRRIGGKPNLIGGLLLAALAAATVASPADATAPGRNGRIAIPRYSKNGDREGIGTARPNGRGAMTLTHARRNVFDRNPDWAPNGHKIVFDRETDISCGSRCISGIYTVHRDGSHLTRLTPNDRSIFSEDPAYSPDGTRIAFDRTTGPRPFKTDIYVMDADGGNVTQVTHQGPSPKYQPGRVQWSPSGTKLVFARTRLSDDANAIYTAKVDGTDFHRRTPWRLDASQPDWSPSGRKIVFESYETGAPDGRSENVFTVWSDGSHLKNVTHDTGGVVESNNPGWSPNGKRIVFLRGDPDGDPPSADVYAIRANGTHVRRVTHSARLEGRPDWGPRAAPAARRQTAGIWRTPPAVETEARHVRSLLLSHQGGRVPRHDRD